MLSVSTLHSNGFIAPPAGEMFVCKLQGKKTNGDDVLITGLCCGDGLGSQIWAGEWMRGAKGGGSGVRTRFSADSIRTLVPHLWPLTPAQKEGKWLYVAGKLESTQNQDEKNVQRDFFLLFNYKNNWSQVSTQTWLARTFDPHAGLQQTSSETGSEILLRHKRWQIVEEGNPEPSHLQSRFF